MATENLYTDGSEFKLPNGRRYRGYYHLHPRKGAMVGAVHVDRSHPVLTPVNKSVSQSLSVQQSQNQQPPQQRRIPVVIAPVEPPTQSIQFNPGTPGSGY